MTFALFSLLICIALNLFCAAYAKKVGGFTLADNKNPRAFLAQTSGKAARANAAQQNGYEVFPAYAAAVLVAHLTGQSTVFSMNLCAIVFVLSRIGFIWAYIENKSLLRSLCWGIGFLMIIALFCIAF